MPEGPERIPIVVVKTYDEIARPPSRPTRSRAAFDLPEAGKVTLKVFDLTGREVRALADDWYPAGSHEVSWNARDAGGHQVAGGIYFPAGSFTDTKRMYLSK